MLLMAQRRDERMIRILREYGELAGPQALVELLDYDERYARAFIAKPPKRMNEKPREKAAKRLSWVVTEIKRLREEARQLEELLNGAEGAIQPLSESPEGPTRADLGLAAELDDLEALGEGSSPGGVETPTEGDATAPQPKQGRGPGRG